MTTMHRVRGSDQDEAIIAELEGLTVGAALRRSARLFADLDFIKDGDRTVQFLEIDRAVDAFASSLLELGLSRGDKVAVWLANSYEWILTYFACARIGVVLVPINTRYTPAEASYLLQQSDARALIMKRRIWDNDYLKMLESIAPSIGNQAANELYLDELPQLKRLIVVGDDGPACGLSFEALAAAQPSALLKRAESAVDPQDPVLIVYTSGTTGKPKGAMHNHVVIKQATRVGTNCQLQRGGRVLGHMPLYHVAGLYMGLLPAMTLGACFVLMQQWDTAEALEIMDREKVSLFGGIPTHFVDLTTHPSLPQRDLSSLKLAWIGGSPVMQATFMHFMKALGLDALLSTYGMTENTISTSFNRPDDEISDCCENRAPILANCEVKIVEANGDPKAVGDIGEVWCRGETVMMGYYKNPEATRATIDEDGWLKTGDLGKFDEKGYLSITGRTKEMYKSGGTNVYPAEIEQHLIRHPSVKMAMVVGVPDERLGEVGFAFVQLNLGASFDMSDLRAHCKGTLAGYKTPRHMSVIDELPRTSTGKIQRSALMEIAIEKLNPVAIHSARTA